VISRRRGVDKIALWNKSKNQDDIILAIGYGVLRYQWLLLLRMVLTHHRPGTAENCAVFSTSKTRPSSLATSVMRTRCAAASRTQTPIDSRSSGVPPRNHLTRILLFCRLDRQRDPPFLQPSALSPFSLAHSLALSITNHLLPFLCPPRSCCLLGFSLPRSLSLSRSPFASMHSMPPCVLSFLTVIFMLPTLPRNVYRLLPASRSSFLCTLPSSHAHATPLHPCAVSSLLPTSHTAAPPDRTPHPSPFLL